jgi:hypothetical protein
LQTWPKHQLHGCGNYWILLRGNTPYLAAFSLAIFERFTTAPGPSLGSKQDPHISALASLRGYPETKLGKKVNLLDS